MQQTGFHLEHCRPNCPKAARNWQHLYDRLTTTLTALNLPQTLGDKFDPVLHHHLPKVCLAGCPNGCSRPKIKDFGVIGYVTPRITTAPCSGCNACVQSCLENAITWQPSGIVIDYTRCLSCGDCLRTCPSGTLTAGESGWELYLGGRVGRHPQFAKLAGYVPTDEEVVAWISETMLHYLENGRPQERLTHFLDRTTESLSQLTSLNEQRADESNRVIF
ncbi:MAG: 4Fe-4S dicluster domain-containing protein [Desulfosporosinus sp.]|nr:4Fe-4S dicluster domain-containing protein [Desulfosporosinus sp.]